MRSWSVVVENNATWRRAGADSFVVETPTQGFYPVIEAEGFGATLAKAFGHTHARFDDVTVKKLYAIRGGS